MALLSWALWRCCVDAERTDQCQRERRVRSRAGFPLAVERDVRERARGDRLGL